MGIKILEQHIADKIAAGEVIERPLSVVKELVENSLDAKATLIEVTIKEGGSGLIRVKDNGSGMSREDLAIAFERHATSKIDEFNDLFRLSTFGFRGEALPSIAAVAQVEMSTAQQGSSLGHSLTISGGVYGEMKEIGAAAGTTVEVKNLFYNIPARRKFLKSASYEAGLIGDLLSKYAMAHADVRFKLTVGNQVTIDTAGLKTTEERMIYFLGDTIKEHIVSLPKTEFMPHHFVTAWLLKEEFTRNNRSQETFFVNGRLIKSSDLSRSLEEGYYTLIAKGRFPIAVVCLELPAEQLDVNIHPAKLEVKINAFERIHQKLVELFKDALWEASISKNAFLLDDHRILANAALAQKQSAKPKTIPAVETSLDVANEPPKRVEPPKTEREPKQQSLSFDLPHPLAEPLKVQQPIVEFKTEKAEEKPAVKPPAEKNAPVISADTPKQNTASSESVSFQQKKPAQIKDIEGLTLMGQLNQSFIIAQNSQGLYIIDQHTCHERILYERFMQEENEKTVLVETLLIPVSINVTPKQDALLIEHILTLRDLGFILESFGERSYLIRGLPLGLSKEDDPAGLLLDIIDDLAQSKAVTPAVIKEKVVTMASCKGAVKANWQLNDVEMLTLLHDLAQVSNAHTCPHGRPIIYKLSMNDLYTIFKRGAYSHES